MKLYTGLGDKGETALFGGQKVKKHDLRVNLYGGLDELNSLIGQLRSKKIDRSVDTMLVRIQNEIFVLSSEIATPEERNRKSFTEFIDKAEIESLEKEIDHLSASVEPLKSFILPGGTEEAALAHIIRTVCRRVERSASKLDQESDLRPEVLVYINRMSDWFFACARYFNHLAGVQDVAWKSIRKK